MSYMANRRVVITGLGMISPLGNSLRESWEGMLQAKSGAGQVTQFDATGYPSTIAAEVKNFNPEEVVQAKAVKRYDRFSLFAMKASREAWQDSGIDINAVDPTMIGTIIGVGIGGLRYLEDNHTELIKEGPRRLSPFLIPAMISNLAPGNVAIDLGFKGVNYTITSACTSGTHAIGEAYRMIKDGLQDIVMTGGAEAAITPLGLGGFGRMKALTTRNDDPTRASRPFDKDRDGFLIGEGAGALVLEEYESARKRGARIYAEVLGYGFSCDAYHITGQLEGGEGAVQCMQMALRSAKINPEQVQYINAHGTSTPLNDPNETLAIKKTFGDYAHKGLMVSSTKSMVGHLLGAAGGLEGVVIAKSVESGYVPPTINLDNPDEGCDLDYVPHTAREARVQIAMSNSFGFGGTNATIVVGKI